ncbi:hypothetical protein [Streptomyces sp. NPDC059166]|uniref:hypothetical protein n=1 Tax=Streptomyces sp. NPDC059166 TaxID=3346752 RepID=UPI00369A0B1B
MISIINTIKMTDPSVVSACSLGLGGSSELALPATGLSAIAAAPRSLATLPVRVRRNERPTEAPEAAVVKAQASAYAFTAAGAGAKKQTTQHHTMWAFRGPEPWSDPA